MLAAAGLAPKTNDGAAAAGAAVLQKLALKADKEPEADSAAAVLAAGFGSVPDGIGASLAAEAELLDDACCSLDDMWDAEDVPDFAAGSALAVNSSSSSTSLSCRFVATCSLPNMARPGFGFGVGSAPRLKEKGEDGGSPAGT